MNTGLRYSFGKYKSSYDIDYQNILDQGILNGYNLPSDPQKDIQNQLVIDLKTNNLWDKLDALWIFSTDAGFDFTRLNWIKPRENKITVNELSSVFFINNEEVGFQTTVHFNFNPSTHGINYQLNDCSWGYYTGTSSDMDTDDTVMGCYPESYAGVGGAPLAASIPVPYCAIDSFHNKIAINKSGTRTNTLASFDSRNWRKTNIFHSIHLLNDKGNYSSDLMFDNEVTNIPTGMPNQNFIFYTGNLLSHRMAYIGANITLSEKTTFKNLIDDYRTDINI